MRDNNENEMVILEMMYACMVMLATTHAYTSMTACVLTVLVRDSSLVARVVHVRGHWLHTHQIYVRNKPTLVNRFLERPLAVLLSIRMMSL